MENRHYRVRINGRDAEPRFIRELNWFRCGVQSRQEHQAHVLAFPAEGEMEIEVTPNFDWDTVTIRPLRHCIRPERVGRSIRFCLPQPAKFSVEFDGRLDSPLFLFANPGPGVEKPVADSPGVYRFAGGAEYEVGEITLSAGETLYIEAGAVVHGWVTMCAAHGARVLGRGILDGCRQNHHSDEGAGRKQMIHIADSENVLIEGITVLNGPAWHIVPVRCRNTVIRDVNIIGFSGCGDGIDVVGCENTTISNCFIRANDDCIAVKSLKGTGTDVRGVRVDGCVCWNAPWGNALEIGFETCCDSISDIVFENCDILHVERTGWNSGGAFTIHNGDQAHIHDVTYRNIRVEDAREKLIDLKVQDSFWSTSAQRGRIDSIRFENISVVDGVLPPSIIQGYDIDHQITDVSIVGLTHRGQPINTILDARLITEIASRITLSE